MSYVSGFMMGAAIGKSIRQMFGGSQNAAQPGCRVLKTQGQAKKTLPAFALVSALPGRRRYRAARIAPEMAKALEAGLSRLDFVESIAVNALSGSILITFAEKDAVRVDGLAAWLEERFFRVPAEAAAERAESAALDESHAGSITRSVRSSGRAFSAWINRHTCGWFDMSSLASLLFALRGLRKMLMTYSSPSGGADALVGFVFDERMAYRMMYGSCYFNLQMALPREERARLAASIRRYRMVKAVSVTEKRVQIWYRGTLPIREIQRLAIATVTRAKEAAVTPAERLAEYRRDALFSLASFAGMEVLKRTSPQLFLSVKVVRSLLVLAIARKFIKNGVQGMVKDHQPNADTLTATAVIASVLAGKPESSLTLLAISNGAEMLTSYAAERARSHISGLLSMDQRYVWLVDGETERKVPIEQVKAGDIIAAHTGEKIVIDGHVLRGDAAINQASITGESNPAMKHKGSPVYAGSVVEAGELVVAVEKVGKDTSLAHIVHLVEEAQTRKAPVQNFADQMANFLVPISFLGAAIVYGATRDWQRVLNLLFIDFSCGLKLSTATAISAAIGAAAKRGILVKGGNYIEALAETDTVVLDKTGTLTIGVPQISFIKTAQGVEEKEAVLLAASAEMHSVHPLAVAIQKYVKEKKWETPHHKTSQTIVARGMQADVPDFEGYKGGVVRVGSKKFLAENGIQDNEALDTGLTSKNLLYVARDKQLIGVIGIEDPIRPKMKKTLNQMRRYGIDEIVMLTGDSKAVAQEVARSMDIDSYHAEILPEDKSDYVNKLKQRGTVMMVGDGINDAPALAFADVGVSLGGRQTDIAAESSAVTIHSEDPSRLMEALQLGRRTMDLVQQNFMATILVNSGAMLLGALGKINPLWAAVIHNTATLAVVLNSCRILRPQKQSFIRRRRAA